MTSDGADFRDVDSYIATLPQETAEVFNDLRRIIRAAVPEGEEAISYRIAALTLHGRYVVYFAGFSKHVSLYPAPIEHPKFKAELKPYASGKGTAKFPLSEPLPAELIERLVRHNAEATVARAAAARTKKKSA